MKPTITMQVFDWIMLNLFNKISVNFRCKWKYSLLLPKFHFHLNALWGMSQIPSHYIIKEWNQKGSFPSSIRHEMFVLNIYYFIKYLWLLSCHFCNVMWWEHIFCFWWYSRDIKVKMKNRLKNSHNIQKIHRSRTYDERKSSSGTLNDILIGTQCAEFCVFLCNFTY